MRSLLPRPRPATGDLPARPHTTPGTARACPPPRCAAAAAAARRQALPSAVADAKAAVFAALASAGGRVGLDRPARGVVEEAVLGLEALAPAEHDWAAVLPGRWRLAFTTAADVAPFLGLSARAQAVLPAKISSALPDPGDIFQEFDPPDAGPDGPITGAVRNVIRVGVPPFLRAGDGLTATVSARYEARSGRRLRLQFEEAAVGGAKLSGLGEALLAPAALPGRGSLQHRAVLAVSEARVAVPLRDNPLARALQPVRDELERAAGSEYLITYLDADTLVGRQTGTGGLFVFFRAGEGE
jgi:hypothetical protein